MNYKIISGSLATGILTGTLTGNGLTGLSAALASYALLTLTPYVRGRLYNRGTRRILSNSDENRRHDR